MARRNHSLALADRSAAARLGWARRSEREEAVTCNIEPELRALWARVGKAIKGTPDERREAFEQYAHDHQGEALEAQMAEADETLDRLIAAREAADAAASEVPF